ncbi:hypothetical protein Voc01_014930 [Virgisporangium ochraceum]|uniref:VWFA domain-containing protein n=2 Tax=Virgisporangium ochraceum TaxID=65505 RepID=A0A8J3ZSB8_9ACTN|nr:hypothetical protein Voc01_014930 [Virgisporangium ochraceum]
MIALLAGALFGYRQFMADDSTAAGCDNPLRLSLAVSPELVPVAQATATDWVRSGVSVANRCIAVDVASAESADVAAAIASRSELNLAGVTGAQQVKVPNLWIPDSSTWLRRLRTLGPNLVPADAPSIASSPVVVAAPQPVATAAFGWPQTKLTWKQLLGKMTTGTGLRAGIVEPTRDAAGLAGLVSLAVAASDGGANAQQNTAAAMRGLVAGRSAVRDDLLQRFPRANDQAALASAISAAPLSEQTVNAYNAKTPVVPLAALYPEPASAALDYPFTIVPGGDADRTTAAERLRAAFTGDKYRDRLAAAGLRAADGTTGKGFPSAPGAPAAGGQGGAAGADLNVVDRILSTWTAMTAPARTLSVFDVSGSMNRPVPTAGNAPRMAVLLEAAKRGLSLFDDTWATGLWVFSTELDGPGTADYKELVPIGPLTSNRQTVLNALNGIKATERGDTGLYDTILAGYKRLKDGWEPGMVNTLIVMTDGENDDKNGLNRDQLLQELGKIKDPAKPVRVLIIAFGPDVAPDGLKPITNLTSGGVFAAPDPAKIGDIFLQAITTR